MYADEAAFKYNTRKMNDGERFASALQGMGGRLTWYVERASEEGESINFLRASRGVSG